MKSLLILAPLALIACGDKSEDTATEETTEETTEEAFAPQEGGWTVSALNITEDSCGFGDEEGTEDEGSVANLTLNTDGSYTLVIDEEMTFSCALANMALTCDEVSETEEQEGMTWTYSFNVSVTFASATELNGSLGMDINCEGDSCAMMEQAGMVFPCTMTGEFSATADAVAE